MKILSQSLRVGGFLLCLLFGTQMIVPGQQASNSDSPQLKSADVVRLVLKGYRLSSPEAVELEKTLLADPENLISRMREWGNGTADMRKQSNCGSNISRPTVTTLSCLPTRRNSSSFQINSCLRNCSNNSRSLIRIILDGPAS